MENDPPQQPAAKPEAPDKAKMDEIRRRRVEKLQGLQGPKPTTTSENSKPNSTSEVPQTLVPQSSGSGKTVSPTKSTTTQPSQPTNPFKKLGVQDLPLEQRNTTSTRAASVENTPKRGREASDSQGSNAPSRKTVAPPKEESIEEWEDRTLSHIFRISLDPHKTHEESSGQRLTFLIDLHKDLVDSEEPTRLTIGSLDTALLEAASKVPKSRSVLDYLLPCWKRTMKAIKGLRGYKSAKDDILKEAKRLCMSNCIFAITMPELFGRESNPSTDSLVPYLLIDHDDDRGICIDFMTEAVSRFDEDDSVRSLLADAVRGLSLQLSSMTMNDNYKPYINALKSFTRFAPLVTAIAEDPVFQMATSANGIERHTILGPFFRISPLQPEVTKVYFAGPKTMDKAHIRTSQNALRMTLSTHQQDLLAIVNSFIRASTTSRNRTLDWFAYVVNSNHKRRAMQVDDKLVSSDGFMMNVTVVLDGLCEPFMDATFSKVSRIEAEYFRRQPRVDIKDETKINADQKESDAFYESKAEGSSNFISEVFFLTLAAHHYGSEATNSKLRNLDREIKHFEKQLALLELERPKFINNPHQMALFENGVKRYNDVLEKVMALKYSIEGILFDDQMQSRSLQFMRYVIVWVLRIASATDYIPGKALSLPLPNDQPEVFKCLPEYVLEDITGNFSFIFRFVPHIIISSQSDDLIALCITFLRNSEYIKNPGIKSGMVSLLFSGTWPTPSRQKGILGDSLTNDRFAHDHLLHALMKFFIEAESTGRSSQFYDKFNIRYEIFQVIKCIWSNDIYKRKLTQESRQNTPFFVRFVNLLLNDVTWVLDEALTKFPKIHDLENELEHRDSMSQEDQAAKEEELKTLESQATNYMSMTNESIAMMKLFTSALSESFTMPEIVQRLADMLDLNLDTMVGPKSTNLRVSNPEKYQFRPKQLLAEIVDVYLNLGPQQLFVQAVARDGRSYKPVNFDSATRILTRFSLKSKDELAAWQALRDRIKLAKDLDDQAEEDLGEVPDELQDPIMSGLMEDPVILPHSRMTVDRSTIQAHLLNDPKDPFNRQPMSIDDVIPDEDMISRIKKFKEERKAEKAQKVADAMDTSAD